MTNASFSAQQLVEWLVSQSGVDSFKRAAELYETWPQDPAKVSLSLKRSLPNYPVIALNYVLEVFFSRLALKNHAAWAQSGLFINQTRQQASHPLLADWHANRFSNSKTLLEVGTGCGFDTIAMSRKAGKVISLESDELIAEFARYNFALLGISNIEVINTSLKNYADSNNQFDSIWADPARRTKNGERIKNPQHYSPSWSELCSLIERLNPQVAGVKLSASLDRSHLRPEMFAEWIGVADECRELIAWHLSTSKSEHDCASLVDEKVSWSVYNGCAAQIEIEQTSGKFLVEPHGALIRTQALEGFASQNGLLMWDRSIAYMFSLTKPPASPWYRSFKVLEAHEYNERKLQQRLHELNWGSRTEFKKRGFPLTPDQVRSKMKLAPSEAFGCVVLTRREEQHFMFLCERSDA